ncbi:MAG TPA: hypothetical protein VKK31_12965 [Thermoanaerobaculia bacterium]|nr:hypothetical protein [Thermoanaerobaculia bacterium]
MENSSSVIVNDLDVKSIAVFPDEADAPLASDNNVNRYALTAAPKGPNLNSPAL